ncbi:MAG: type IX secretion system membrane protein PorP/SprF [Bacteroidia bacterium]|nr:type IX secretion system membrane protein PorP/SprF [Bacteroidia bacterium]
MRIRIFLINFFVLVSSYSLIAQDPQFSQFYAVPLYTNPALTGSTGNIRFNAAYRDQFYGITNNYKTTYASLDAHFNSISGGLGFSFLNDVAGDGRLTTNQVGLAYAFHTQLNRKFHLRSAIQGTWIQKSYDFSKFKWGDQIDPRLGFVNPTNEQPVGAENRMLVNVNAGAIVYSEFMFFGAAVHNITEPNQSFYFPTSAKEEYKLPRRYTVHSGVNLTLIDHRDEEQRTILSPNILYMSQRNFNQLNIGMYIKRQALTAGLWIRQTSNNTDAAILLLGVRLPMVKIGYSYDATLSGAKVATKGSHEISLAIEINKPQKTRTRIKVLQCPAL